MAFGRANNLLMRLNLSCNGSDPESEKFTRSLLCTGGCHQQAGKHARPAGARPQNDRWGRKMERLAIWGQGERIRFAAHLLGSPGRRGRAAG